MNRVKFSLCVIALLALSSCRGGISRTLLPEDARKIAALEAQIDAIPEIEQSSLYPTGSYEHFVSHRYYLDTMVVYRDKALLAQADASSPIYICLSQQRGRLYVKGQVAMDWPVSTGTEEKPTSRGHFVILEKKKEHFSGRFGSIRAADGSVLVADADSRKHIVPPGGKWEGAPMPNWMRLTDSGIGMHTGTVVPGMRLSHGCIRMPHEISSIVFDIVKLGSPVYVMEGVESHFPCRQALSSGDALRASARARKVLEEQLATLRIEADERAVVYAETIERERSTREELERAAEEARERAEEEAEARAKAERRAAREAARAERARRKAEERAAEEAREQAEEEAEARAKAERRAAREAARAERARRKAEERAAEEARERAEEEAEARAKAERRAAREAARAERARRKAEERAAEEAREQAEEEAEARAKAERRAAREAARAERARRKAEERAAEEARERAEEEAEARREAEERAREQAEEEAEARAKAERSAAREAARAARARLKAEWRAAEEARERAEAEAKARYRAERARIRAQREAAEEARQQAERELRGADGGSWRSGWLRYLGF